MLLTSFANSRLLNFRPHRDCGNVIYHKYDPYMTQDCTERLEQTQYFATLAVTGAWRGTGRQRFLNELGWENFYHRRWFRCLCHFFSLRKSHQPAYLFAEIPAVRQISYSLRNPSQYDPALSRTARFSDTYFQNVIFEWNSLAENIHQSQTLRELKRKLLAKIRLDKRSTFATSDTLRVRFSPLNEHRFRHNFEAVSPICRCNAGIEDNEHVFLHCLLFEQMRNDFFDHLSEIPGLELDTLSPAATCELLLGNPRFNDIANNLILEATISFILATKRLE